MSMTLLKINCIVRSRQSNHHQILKPSPDPNQTYVAYAIGTTGDEVYDIQILHVESNTIVDSIVGVESYANVV